MVFTTESYIEKKDWQNSIATCNIICTPGFDMILFFMHVLGIETIMIMLSC